MPSILVVGPESSGTQVLAATLAQAGAQVFHRSMPHGGARPHRAVWPDLHGFKNVDCVIVTARDPFCIAASQVDRGMSRDDDEAFGRVAEAYRTIFEQIAEFRGTVLVVPLEALQRRETLDCLCEYLDLDATQVVDYADPNAKWYGGARFSDRRSVTERLNIPPHDPHRVES